MSVETWTNWSRSVEAHPRRIEHPASTAEVVALLQVARSQGLPVKAVRRGPLVHARSPRPTACCSASTG